MTHLQSDETPSPISRPATPVITDDASPSAWVDLAAFDNSDYDAGRGLTVRTLWYFCSLAFVECGWLPVSKFKVWLLRNFGARVGQGVVIKPHVRIKFPWRLSVGDHCWIGQDAWIDNMADVEIGDHVCISQLVYLCTGSHDHRRRAFDLIAKPIRVGNGAWIGARSMILPGVAIGANAIVAGGSVVTRDVPAAVVVAGVPAHTIADRTPPAA